MQPIVRVFVWGLLMILVVFAVVRGRIIAQYTTELYTISRLIEPVGRCGSFDNWCEMIQQQPYLTSTDLSAAGIGIPTEPHLILCNHIASHFAMGSHITLAGAIHAPCRVVCSKRYDQMYFISGIFHRLLQHEIRVDLTLGRKKKEAIMVTNIRASLDSGRNIVMFIDAGCYSSPMRSLNRAVLRHFPSVLKQIVHLMEPTSNNDFRFKRLPATTSLDDIITMREQLLMTG